MKKKTCNYVSKIVEMKMKAKRTQYLNKQNTL